MRVDKNGIRIIGLRAMLLIGVFLGCAVLRTQVAMAQALEPGEELNYSVSYLGIRLGTVRMVNEGLQDLNGRKVYKCKAYINSAAGIPFVDLHTTFETWMDTSARVSYQFIANTKEDDGWLWDKYFIDYDKRVVNNEKFKNGKKIISKQIVIDKKYSDGASIFYCARELLFAKNKAKIPTMIGEEKSVTTINFNGKREVIEIDAISHPVRTVYFEGLASWKGIYGVTGEFEGWFSDDDARVPIKATMELYLGSAQIELESWKRKGWKPPVGK